MTATLPELRRAFAASFSGRASTACPPPEDLWDTIELRLPVERRREIADHLAECRICAESCRIALRMGATPSRRRRAMRDLADSTARRRLRGVLCRITDHDYIDPPGSPEPFCRRCGCSTYWPIRRTLGRYLEGARVPVRRKA